MNTKCWSDKLKEGNNGDLDTEGKIIFKKAH